LTDVNNGGITVEIGYSPVSYDPVSRKINRLNKPNSEGNTIYLRESSFDSICKRVKKDSSFYVKGQDI